jgi:hypothetical protein
MFYSSSSSSVLGLNRRLALWPILQNKLALQESHRDGRRCPGAPSGKMAIKSRTKRKHKVQRRSALHEMHFFMILL